MELRNQYKDVFEQYEVLVEDHNSKLEQAEKVVRAQEVTCGPFELYQWQTKYKAEALYDAVGREQFLTGLGVIGRRVDGDLVLHDAAPLRAAHASRREASPRSSP